MRKFKLTCLLLIFSSASFAFQWQFFKSNKFDKHGERNGRWKFYLNEEKKSVYRKGKFKHGLETGKWKYFDENGRIHKIEKYSKDRKTIFTKIFYPDGKIESVGQAKLVIDSGNTLHYYWNDEWLFFNQNGKLIKRAIYETGREKTVQKF